MKHIPMKMRIIKVKADILSFEEYPNKNSDKAAYFYFNT